MISHIMIKQQYHIVLITYNRPKKLSYHLIIWYPDTDNYHIISKVIFRSLKYIISFNKNKTSNTESFVLIDPTQYHRLLQNQGNYHIVSLMINFPSKISYRIIDDKYFLRNIISYHWWYLSTGKLSYRIIDDKYFLKKSYHIIDDKYLLKNIISYHW
jgi:hypothetical protein